MSPLRVPISFGLLSRLALPLALLASLGLVTAAAAGVTPAHTGQARRFTSLCGAMAGTHPATVGHVMVIAFENKAYNAIVGNRAAPYLNGTLIPGCGLATDYHSFSHPSLPNYLALTSGTAQAAATSTDCNPSGCPQPQASIFSQLAGTGRQWREYAEAMPGNCRPTNFDDTSFVNANGGRGEFYYVRHAPPAYYTSPPVPGDCARWDVPLGTTGSGSLLAALSPSADGLPAYSFVTPGGCNDMHDCSTTVGDDWLRTWVPLIQGSAAYQSGQLVVFITVDEGVGPDKAAGEACADAAHANPAAYPSCHVPTIVMSPYTTPGTRSGSYFNHLGLLGTAEDLLGLPRLPATSGAAGLGSAFGL